VLPIPLTSATRSGYGEAQLGLAGPHLLQRGGRYDDSTASGEVLAADPWPPSPVTETRLHGAWGKRIKAPSSSTVRRSGIPAIRSQAREVRELGEIGRPAALWRRSSRPESRTSTTTSAT
jgi:hypothetical protein